MTIQTNYQERIDPAVAGEIANMVPATLISRTVETEAGIAIGAAVEQGTADYGIVAYAGGTVLGITARERSLDANAPNSFADGDTARVMTKGTIWVTCATGCSAGDGVFVRPSNGDFQDSSANSAVQIANARWETSAAAAGLAIIRLG